MSSLTTPGQGGRGIGDEDDEDVVEVMPGLVPAIVPALHSVFECPNIELCIVKGMSGWRCVWCDQSFPHVHASRALAHLLRRKKCDIRVCKAVIPPNYLLQYEALYHASTNSKEARKRHNKFVMDNVVTDQMSAVGTMLDHWGLLHVPHASIPSVTCSSNSSSIGNNGHPATYSSTKRSFQSSISTSFQKQGDICKCHNATLEFAIADLFHTENIPDRVVESARFQRVIKVAQLCGDEFVCPDREKLGVNCWT
jgi:hypothetical protein